MLNKLQKERLIIILGLLTLVFFLYSFFIVKKETIFADGAGYFSYPYQLIHEGNLSYSAQNASTIFGVTKENNVFINKYPIGTGIFLVPAFLSGEVINQISGNIHSNIYNQNFQFFVGIWGIIFLLLGIYVLKKVLVKFFNNQVTNLTLIATVFATNLFIYGSTDASFSHIYSFLCINLFLLFLINWNQKTNLKNSFFLGLTLGLAVLLRQSNITVIILFVLYGIDLTDLSQSIKCRVLLYKSNLSKIAVILLVCLLVFVPQIIYWLIYTRNIFIFSYGQESFNFLAPQILNVLFNIKRGVLIWHPIFILSILGLIFLRKKVPQLVLATSLLLAVNFIVVAPWWNWDYGIGFGHRAFTDYLGLFALGLAGLISEAWGKIERKKIVTVVLGLLISVNLILAVSYIQQQNNWAVPNLNTYLNSFLQFHL